MTVRADIAALLTQGLAETCRHGHPRTPDTTRRDGRGNRYCVPCRRASCRESWRRRWDRRHKDHTTTRTRDGRRQCLTCLHTWSMDHAAVARAIAGDPPPRLTPAEREAAVLQLRDTGLPGVVVAQRVGCTDRTVWRILRRTRQETTS